MTQSMPSKNVRQRLSDLIENVDAIGGFTAGYDMSAFLADRKTIYAVVRALEIISESSRRLPADLRDRHPEIDWVAVAAAGNVYLHEYESVDANLIWNTIRHEIGGVRKAAEEELARLQGLDPAAG
jgi:uncharacterized protein with HEPN domain